MRRLAAAVLLQAGDVHVHLLHGADPLHLAHPEVQHGAKHAAGLRVQVYARVGGAAALVGQQRQMGDLQRRVQGAAVGRERDDRLRRLERAELPHEAGRQRAAHASDNHPVEEHTQIVVCAEALAVRHAHAAHGHAQTGQKLHDTGPGEQRGGHGHLAEGRGGHLHFGGVGEDAAFSGEVVEQAAGGAVGRVHGAQEAPGLWQQLAHCCRLCVLGGVCVRVSGWVEKGGSVLK